MESQRSSKHPRGSVIEELAEELEEHLLKSSPQPEFVHVLNNDVNPNTREIFVDGEIEEDFGNWFTKVHRYLVSKSKDPIVVWLNTPGGSVEAMLAFYDLVKTSPVEIYTIGVGSVCSAGVLMLACGNKRMVTENCVLMTHEHRGLSDLDLRHSEAKERRKYEDWLHSHWFKLMGRCTEPKRDATFWKRKTEGKAEYWLLGAEDIITDGLADEVYSADKLPESCRKK